MTSKQRQAALRARRKSQGLVRVEVWVPEANKKDMQMAAEGYRTLANWKKRRFLTPQGE